MNCYECSSHLPFKCVLASSVTCESCLTKQRVSTKATIAMSFANVVVLNLPLLSWWLKMIIVIVISLSYLLKAPTVAIKSD